MSVLIDGKETNTKTLYLQNMQRIKYRTQAIDDILTKRATTSYIRTNIEFCVLQIRKILELIAFSSLISDAEIYGAQLKNIEKMWKASFILNDIERIHPNFYPKPIQIDPVDKSQWIDQEAAYLTKEKFEHIYDKCGKYLHEASPFLSEKQIEKAYDGVWNEIPVWRSLIVNLLNTHIVHLYKSTDLFYVSMGNIEQKPFGAIFGDVGRADNGQDEV